MNRKRVGIVVFPDVEVLDFCGPFEVFSVTRLNEERRCEEPSPFEVVLVAEQEGVVVATGGLRVVARYYGDSVARMTARNMEYPFPDDNSRRV
ncbi:MAG: hypothetical protein HYZ72_02710 [Deltaproteobacteria bacterium]|nr:hypothetical protein [Deltaproteobacteria bacterium]